MVGEVVVQAQITTGERRARWWLWRFGNMEEMTLHLVVCVAYWIGPQPNGKKAHHSKPLRPKPTRIGQATTTRILLIHDSFFCDFFLSQITRTKPKILWRSLWIVTILQTDQICDSLISSRCVIATFDATVACWHAYYASVACWRGHELSVC